MLYFLTQKKKKIKTVIMLSYANNIWAVASYVKERNESSMKAPPGES